MNNTFNTQISFDSLGRKLGVANGFSAYTPQMLEYMKADLGLFMSLSDLTFIRNYYKDSKQHNITLSELYFLDTLLKNTRSLPLSKALINLWAENAEVISTYNDLISKRHYVKGEINQPLSFSDMAEVSSEYMKKIGIIGKKNNLDAFRVFRLSDGSKPLSRLYSPAVRKLTDDNAFLIVSPKDGISDYTERFERFSESDAFGKYVVDTVRTDQRGIAFALSCLADGVFGDLYSVPNISYPAEISALASDNIGSFIIALDKLFIPEITEAAGEFGLDLTYFAKSVPNQKFTLLNNQNSSMCIDTELIRILGSSLSAADFKITKPISSEDSAYADICLASSEGLKRLEYGDIVSMSGNLLSLSRANIHEPHFLAGISTALNAILPLLACGVRTENISMTVRYALSDLSSAESCGDALALILGVYRVMVELCIPDSSEIEYAEGKNASLCCAARADIPQEIAPSHFKQVGDAVYLLSFDKGEDGMPDFSSFRKMSEFLNTLIATEQVVSVRAVSGSLCDALRIMKGRFDFAPESSVGDILYDKIQGFIVETPFPLTSGILLGSVTQNIGQTI